MIDSVEAMLKHESAHLIPNAVEYLEAAVSLRNRKTQRDVLLEGSAQATCSKSNSELNYINNNGFRHNMYSNAYRKIATQFSQ